MFCYHSPEIIERVCQLIKEGYSSAAVARMVGLVSRNAAIGIAHRHGHKHGLQKLRRSVRPGPKLGAKRVKPKAKARPEPRINRAAIVHGLPTAPLPQVDPNKTGRILLHERERSQCAFIPQDPRTDPRCCGDAVVPGLSYCEAHARRCYVAPAPRTQKHTPVEPALEPARRVRVFA